MPKHSLFRVAAAILLILVGWASTPRSVAEGPAAAGDRAAVRETAPGRVIVKLKGAPLLAGSSGKPAMASSERVRALEAVQRSLQASIAARLPGATVERAFQWAYNGLAVRLPHLDAASLAVLRALPNVEDVYEENVYEPTLYATRDALGTPALWAALGGPEHAGEGVRIAILDSGVAPDHPMLDPAGFAYPPGFPKGDMTATTPKVIAARVFFRATDPPLVGEETPRPGPNGSSHGTHLASIAAGVPVAASWPGGSGQISGVAPRAYVMNYRIFYPAASGGAERAYTAEILQAIEMAVLDGADVILAAWNSAPTRLPLAAPEREALEAAIDAGAIVIAGAGNDGPGYASASRLPGGLERVITVGAQGQPYGRALFGAEMTAPLGPLPLRDVRDVAAGGSPYACAPLPAASLAGKAALILRGQCPFATKAYYAQQAGAALAVIMNTEDKVVEMACVGEYCGAGVITIPAVSVSSSLGESLRAWIASSPPDAATLRLDPIGRVASFTPQWVAPFSARGPAFAYLLKPDVIAPGQFVVAASLGGGYEALSGTSVAAAHVAGAAALLRQVHPSWGHDEIKAALMASARLQEEAVYPVPDTASVLAMGAGLVDLSRLITPTLLFDPPSLSLPSLSAGESITVTVTVRDIRPSGPEEGWNAQVQAEDLWSFSAPAEVHLSPGEAVTLPLHIQVAPGAPPGDVEGRLFLVRDGERFHLPLWGHIMPPPQPATVLLLDNDFSHFDSYPDYAPFVIQALQAAGLNYAVWDADAHFGQPQTIPDLAVLQQHDVILWLTGDNIHPDGYYQPSTPMTARDQELLMAYLEQGGRLLAVGQNLAEASDVNPDADPTWGRSTLYHHYLGAHWLQGALYGGGFPPSQTASLLGLPGTFLESVALDVGNIGTGADNQSSIDEIAPGGLPDGSDADLVRPILFAIGAQPMGGSLVGVAKAAEPSLEKPTPALNYRTAYFSFGPEGINDRSGVTTRAELLSKTISWLRDAITVTVPSPIIGGSNRPVRISCQATSSEGAPMRRYRWRVGEGAAARLFESTAPTIYVLFEELGEYPVMVEAEDALGHRALGEGLVRIIPGGASYLEVAPATVQGGEPMTYTVHALNTAPIPITLAFTLPLPSGVTYVRHSGSGATYGDDRLTWQGEIAPGQEATATLTVGTPATGSGRVPVTATATFDVNGLSFERSATGYVEYLPPETKYYLPIVRR